MRIKVSRSAIIRNLEIALKLCRSNDVKCALMIKEFYKVIFDCIPYVPVDCIYGVGISENNYILNDYRDFNSGMTISSIEDLVYREGISYYIPINNYDNRDGLEVKDAIRLKNLIRDKCNNPVCAIITNGCLSDDFRKDSFPSLADKLIKEGFDKITVGGSFFLSFLLNKDFNISEYVDEIRIGEFALYGTIPFYKEVVGSNSITVESKVQAIYPEREEYLINVGKAHLDILESSLITKGIIVKRVSSEYTLIRSEKKLSKGDKIIFAPSYHSLPKLLRWKERLVLN